MLTFNLYTQIGGALISDYSSRLTKLQLSTNMHGIADVQASVSLFDDAWRLYDQGPPYQMESNLYGTPISTARSNEVTLDGDGVDITGYGLYTALDDVQYTALWSDTDETKWKPVGDRADIGYNASRYSFDTNNGWLYIAPKKNEAMSNAVPAAYTYAVPRQSRLIVGISFDYEVKAPTSWRAECNPVADDYSAYGASLWGLATTGAVQTGTIHATTSGYARMLFALYYNSGTALAYGGETGDAYLKISNVRIVTSLVNRINATLGAAVAAGTSVTATVGSTAHMYVGQQLQVESGTNGETVVIQSITSATQFVATFTRSHASGVVVQAHVVYSDEIASDILTTYGTANPGIIDTSTSKIQSPALDLMSEVYEDAQPTTILQHLSDIGDGVTTVWRAGVDASRVLFFQPRLYGSQTYYVDVESEELLRSLNDMINAYRVTYKDASGSTARSNWFTDANSINRYKTTRQKTIKADDYATGTAQAAAQLAKSANPAPRAKITFTRIYNSFGTIVPLARVQAGDVLVIRNLPPTLSAVLDSIRSFVIGRTVYVALPEQSLSVEPELPLATVPSLLALLK